METIIQTYEGLKDAMSTTFDKFDKMVEFIVQIQDRRGGAG
jgi:hypothetical protein